MSSTTASSIAGGTGARRRLARARELLDSPVATYYLLLSTTMLLTMIGLIMVLSASMIVSIKDSDTPYAVFFDQAIFATAGLVAMLVAMRIPLGFWKRIGGVALVGALGLQLLVFTPLGVEVQGNRNWIGFAGFSIQPSELAKIALILFGARVLTQKRRVLGSFGQALVPFVIPAAGLVLLFVMLGHDLGTAIVIALIVAGMLFAGGVPLRWFAFGGIGGLALLAALSVAAVAWPSAAKWVAGWSAAAQWAVAASPVARQSVAESAARPWAGARSAAAASATAAATARPARAGSRAAER